MRRPCDVVEDILRVYGYNNVEIDSQVKSSLSIKTATDFAEDMQELISNQLTAMGYREIMNNSLTASALYEGGEKYPAEKSVRIMNALSSDLNVMRQTLLYGGLDSIARNINHKNANVKFYEFGNVYSFNASADNTTVALAPYTEHAALGLWITGKNHDGNWAEKNRPTTVYDLKAAVESVLTRLGISEQALVVEQADNDLVAPALVYKNRGGKEVAFLGVVTPTQLKKADVEQDVFFAQLNWNALCKLAAKTDVKYADLPKTLPVKRDLALLVDRDVTYEQIKQVVLACEKRLLREVSLFDVYEGKNLEPGKKSYAISIFLQDDVKTLQDKQIDAIMQKIITSLEKQVGAKLR